MIVLSSPTVHVPSPQKVVLMSGLSDPDCCALSRIQQQFLERLPVPADQKLYANFPYLPPTRTEQRPVNLIRASWHNWNQFLRAGKSPYRDHALAHWRALVESCEGLLVITLSCGLQILNVCLSTGIRPQRLQVLALGPVAWQRPPAPHLLVRGSRDYVCNPRFTEADLILPGVSHLEYLHSPAVVELAQARLRELAASTSQVGGVGCNS